MLIDNFGLLKHRLKGFYLPGDFNLSSGLEDTLSSNVAMMLKHSLSFVASVTGKIMRF